MNGILIRSHGNYSQYALYLTKHQGVENNLENSNLQLATGINFQCHCQSHSIQEPKQPTPGKTRNEQTSQGRKLTVGRTPLIPQQQCLKPRKSTNTYLMLSTQS